MLAQTHVESSIRRTSFQGPSDKEPFCSETPMFLLGRFLSPALKKRAAQLRQVRGEGVDPSKTPRS